MAIPLLNIQKQDVQKKKKKRISDIRNSLSARFIMKCVTITRDAFIQDPQGRTFADVWDDSQYPFDELLELFNDADWQRRMEESETHHDRPALAGVVRELEAHPRIDEFLATAHPRRSKRFRQAVGVLVRMIMEKRGWQKTGRKGSLGVRAKTAKRTATPGAYHNTGGLAYWFLRAERYEPAQGRVYQTVKERCAELESTNSSTATA
jgi:hypothetical protein